MARYVIENNKITRVCQRLADGGSIYTLSYLEGSIIRGNVMDDCKIAFGGLYLDEGSGGFVAIENNIATETVYQAYFYHVVGDYSDREQACAAVMKNNYFKTGSVEDEEYKRIWDTAGILPPAEDSRFTVSADPETVGGTVRVSGDTARAGEIVTVTAEAEPGYILKEFTSNSADVVFYEENGVYKMIMPDANEVIGALFVQEDQESETVPSDGCKSVVGFSSSVVLAAGAAAVAVVLKKRED
ncbi:MAG: hypothetical protein E7610_08595 [Ruminococcaceae bacterium]|nr:hypothetical protein [Oscillospiraceae bacterium]